MTKRVVLTISMMAAFAGMSAQKTRDVVFWQASGNEAFPVNQVDSMTFQQSSETVMVWSSGGSVDTLMQTQIDSVTFRTPEITSTNRKSDDELKTLFNSVKINSSSYRKVGNTNPLMGHKFGADPFGMEYNGRLYVYMTDDHMYDSKGNAITSGYSDIRCISIISSADLVNWTDHGAIQIAGSGGPAKWANNSWAPCAAHKTINGKEKFFMYFADNGSGIGVVTSDTPYGPWTDPLGKQIISRSTPNCSDVTWLFDPAVMVDNDGKAYLYFGGGVPDGKQSDPGTARCVQLGDDMISIVGTPQKINPPYLFEDSGINHVGNKYLYSYCSNWTSNSNPGVAKIAYMTSDSPLGPFKFTGAFFDNPGGASWAGGGGNNHHAVVKFKGKYYILYHTRTLKKAMALSSDFTDSELRSTCISELKVDETTGVFNNLSASQITEKGPAQIENLDPYQKVEGETMAWQNGMSVSYEMGKYIKKVTVAAEAKAGSWITLSNVDFKNGPSCFTAKVKGKGVMKVVAKKGYTSTVLGYVEMPGTNTYTEVTIPLLKPPVGVYTYLTFQFSDEASLDYWQFY